MKRLLFIFAVAALLVAAPLTASAEGVSFLASGGVWTDDAFKAAGGGFLTGTLVPLDGGRGLFLRALYHQFGVGADPLQSVNLAAVLKFDLGKKYGLYFNVGGEDYMGADLGSAIVGGVGCEKIVWTGPLGDETAEPWLFKLFGEVDAVNHNVHDTAFNKSLRLFFGFAFTPVVKK